jgi:hypothetical protein
MIGTPGSASTSSGNVGPHMLSRCPAMSVAKTFDWARCARYYPPGLPAIPQSRLLFLIGGAFCPPFASSSTTCQQNCRKWCCCRLSSSVLSAPHHGYIDEW